MFISEMSGKIGYNDTNKLKKRLENSIFVISRKYGSQYEGYIGRAHGESKKIDISLLAKELNIEWQTVRDNLRSSYFFGNFAKKLKKLLDQYENRK